MQPSEAKVVPRVSEAARVLQQLHQMGAINLDVMVEKAAEIRTITAAGSGPYFDDDEPWYRMCYQHYIHVGPSNLIDLVSVADKVSQLGYRLTRTAQKMKE